VYPLQGGEDSPPGFSVMAVKPLTRTELIQLILYEADEASARQLLINFPAMTRDFKDLVALVCQGEPLTGPLFDTLCAAWQVVRPEQTMDAGL
jgi:hypothetical protein